MDLFPDIFAAKRLPARVQNLANLVATFPYGGVGTYVIAYIPVSAATTLDPNTTVAGSSLLYHSASGANNYTALNLQQTAFGFFPATNVAQTSLSLTGTWRVLTYMKNTAGFTYYIAGLFVRII